MATIRESLKKLVEVAKPVPGDEQEFVAKHGMQVLDFQGKDSLSAESPYDHILKNVAAIKKPGDPGKEDHGHDAPGESEAAYHIPESREEKIAKLSIMMEATIDPKEQQLADNLKSLLAETFSLYLKSHHYHWNVMGPDFAQYHDFLGELYKEVHGAVDMIAESIRVLGELAPGNLGSQDVSTYTNPLMMVNDLMMDNEKVIASLNNSYKLAESMNRLGISNFLQDRLTAHEKHHWMLQAISGIKGEEPMQEAKDVVGVKMHYHNPKTGEKFHEVHFTVPAAEKFRKQHEKAGFRLVKKEAQMAEASLPLLPQQKQIARDLLKKEMEDNKKKRNDNRQAGTPKITESEEDRREKNDKEREIRVATPRPHTSNDLEGMRYRLQAVKKQIIDKT
jgi:starvation-inducible DNA-binding protein